MGLRSLKSHILLTSWQEKPLSILKQRQTHMKRHWIHQELTWLNPLPAAAIRETSRKPHLDATGLGVVREQTLEQCHGHSDMHIPFPGMSNNELRGNLFVPIDWTPFSVFHSCDTNWVSGRNQFTHCPGKTPSDSKTSLCYTPNPSQAYFMT